MNNAELYQLAQQTGILLKQQGLMMASAESCTGGWLGQTVTSVPGSSTWYERGFVTYSNISKQQMLGVCTATLTKYGAVSEPTAQEMAAGAITHSNAQVSCSITGIAGPGGGTTNKPVGMICLGWAIKNSLAVCNTQYLNGDRNTIRHQAVVIALQGIIDLLNQSPHTVA